MKGGPRRTDWAARASIATWAAREEAKLAKAAAAKRALADREAVWAAKLAALQAKLIERARPAALDEVAQAETVERPRRGPYRCGACHKYGHNRATCNPQKAAEAPAAPVIVVEDVAVPRGRPRSEALEAEIMVALGWRWHGVADILHLVEQEYGTVGSTTASSKRLIICALRRLEAEGHVIRDGEGNATVYRAARRRSDRRRRILMEAYAS